MPERNELLALLDAIEDSEARYLSWSLVDEAWERDELLNLLKLEAPQRDPSSLLSALQDENLIGELPNSWPVRYRSRMAETVRLMAYLRQQFPRQNWRTAPSLVADFRFLHEARRFPLRNVAPEEVLRRLGTHKSVTEALAKGAAKVLGDRLLSAFQVRSAEEVFDAIDARADRAVVVCAGTGSGKTLAFYLPALAHLASLNYETPATEVVAIYPRNELLKDQLSTAIDECRRLRRSGGRQLRIGAFFGPTPKSSRTVPETRSGWVKLDKGWRCPFLTCRAVGADGTVCEAPLYWNESDRRAGREHLTCGSCGDILGEDEFTLTRQSMQSSAPDLLFATTEMLNRSLSDGWSMNIFGVGPHANRAPRLVLLDEAHAYVGTNGAQVAYLLRRWRHAVATPMAFVGLSATLANAEQFFSELSGVPSDFVREVVPHPNEMEARGREYQLVLRGDPASQTALLSTSIQSIMLIRRMLDLRDSMYQTGAYGRRVFAFCDNLDLVNRLYRQLLDSEGRTPFNKPDPTGFMLAALRMESLAHQRGEAVNWEARDTEGQRWWFAEALGFGGESLSIGRTSSQDHGVELGADVVVATAALEVGFDDPGVGAVLQHKAPRDVAQFVQRRGRAGRVQSQRPWTIVVLSDFGRDRAAYQDYEALFDPQIPPRSLPLGNQSVKRMQAAMCVMDWSALRLNQGGQRKTSTRRMFAGKSDVGDTARLLGLLEDVLQGGPEQKSLSNYVQRALRLSDEELKNVLWGQPRPLLLEVVPTAFRRIKSEWAHEAPLFDTPLPEFIPRTLFDDLLLPEVQIEAPDGYNVDATTSMGVLQALNELAPGKVTLRWAVKNVTGLWLPPGEGDAVELPLENGFASEGEVVGRVPANHTDGLPIVRPLVIRPTRADKSVRETSTGRLIWELDTLPTGDVVEIPRPRDGFLNRAINKIEAHLYGTSSPLRIRRYARTVDAVVRRTNGSDTKVVNTFTWMGSPAAVGYEMLVDSMHITAAHPTIDQALLTADARRLQQLRRDRFDEITKARLEELGLNQFLSTRVVEVVVGLLAFAALDEFRLATAISAPDSWWHDRTTPVIRALLMVGDNSEDSSKLEDALHEALHRSEVLDIIRRSIPVLSEVPGDKWTSWLTDRYLATLAAAVQSAAQHLCPEFDLDSDVVVDIVPSNVPGVSTIMVSDAIMGGGSAVEALARRVSDDPRRFDQLILTALEPTDLEEADLAMRSTLDFMVQDDRLEKLVAEFRDAPRQQRLDLWRQLLALLGDLGVPTSHAVGASLSNRVFRPGSSTGTDELLRSVLAGWDRLEDNLGFAVGHVTAAVALAQEVSIAQALRSIAPRIKGADHEWINSILRSLLWARAEERRATSLAVSNRFVMRSPKPERTLVLDVLDLIDDTIDVDARDWRDALTEVLVKGRRAFLTSGTSGRRKLQEALISLALDPIETGWLLAYVGGTRAHRRGGRLGFVIELEEAPQ